MDERYAETWRGYRRLRRPLLASELGAGCALAMLVIGGPLARGVLGAFAFAAWSLGLLGIFFFGWRLHRRTMCPRCGKPFFDRPYGTPGVWWTGTNPFARRCVHCRQPKWATGPERAPATRPSLPEGLIPVLPKNYRRIALAAIERAASPVVLMDGRRVTDFSHEGPVTQRGIRRCRDFEVRDGAVPILGFHDHPNEMWVSSEFEALADQCAAAGWLRIQGASPGSTRHRTRAS